MPLKPGCVGRSVSAHPKTQRCLIALGATGLCLSILLAIAAPAQVPPQALAPAPTPPPTPRETGIPVTLDGEVVFYVRSPLGPFTVQERAKAARRRLLRIAEDPFYSETLFRIQKSDAGTLIFYREDLVGIITEPDAEGLHQSQEDLASE